MSEPKDLDSESDDFKRGFHAGVKYMERMDDESAVVGVLIGGEPKDGLSPRQARLLAECRTAADARAKAEGRTP